MGLLGRSRDGVRHAGDESAIAALRSVAFPIDRRGYSKRAVERYLDSVAQELEDMPRAARSSDPGAMLGAARLEADRIRALAEQELAEAAAARAEAQQLLEEARSHVKAALEAGPELGPVEPEVGQQDPGHPVIGSSRGQVPTPLGPLGDPAPLSGAEPAAGPITPAPGATPAGGPDPENRETPAAGPPPFAGDRPDAGFDGTSPDPATQPSPEVLEAERWVRDRIRSASRRRAA